MEEFLELPHGIPSRDTFSRVFARQVVDADAEYVLSLKDNQPNHHEKVGEYFEGIEELSYLPQHVDYHKLVDTGHGGTAVA